jgi:putative endonuclease
VFYSATLLEKMKESFMGESHSSEWCVYVLKCRNNYLYIGCTNNLERRLKEHENGTGSKFVRAWRPFVLVKAIPCSNGREARQMEYRLKRMKRCKKIETLGLRVLPIGHRLKGL